MYHHLVQVRKGKQLTIHDMAKVIGKSPANYYKKEMGRVTVSVEEALLIAHFLQREISYLFGQ